MTFFRPEAKAAVWRWREAIAGALVTLAGLWLISGPGFLLAVPGYAFLFGGIVLIWLGIQRGRFRGPDGGAGAVQVDEGQVTYFGPLTGGTVALREMESLTLEGAMFPAHWRLAQKGQPPLLIPINAAGADALFDAFATLPGLRTERMLSTLRTNPHQAVVIWQRGPLRPEGALLH
ncbi:hypothetical protein GV827_09220 [Sulfitobacter sp. JBTF-M27]|uniref:Uncharacterized protein n=1 Tax=Sulfitobacter sediminilitoris TaxID=2698830 RepID=A0A6P0CDM0_9RHOB|nr:hypothetical protein [Sulfitobacter sediminilitoris]NEK22583.1 hypothetical protein [Sulfitobacter sediminilitoris]